MTQPNKATVQYRPSNFPIVEGTSAWVYPVDHTSPMVSNKQIARTSRVLSYDRHTGVFETMNSIYKPLKD